MTVSPPESYTCTTDEDGNPEPTLATMNWHLTAGNIPMNFVMTPNQDWVSASPPFAAIAANSSTEISGTVVFSGNFTAAGDYPGGVLITADGYQDHYIDLTVSCFVAYNGRIACSVPKCGTAH